MCVTYFRVLLGLLKTGRSRKDVGVGDKGGGSGLLRDTDIVVLVQQKKT